MPNVLWIQCTAQYSTQHTAQYAVRKARCTGHRTHDTYVSSLTLFATHCLHARRLPVSRQRKHFRRVLCFEAFLLLAVCVVLLSQTKAKRKSLWSQPRRSHGARPESAGDRVTKRKAVKALKSNPLSKKALLDATASGTRSSARTHAHTTQHNTTHMHTLSALWISACVMSASDPVMDRVLTPCL